MRTLPKVTAPAWPKVSFEAAALDATGGNAKLTRSDYQASGALPVIDQGQSDIAGYTDDLNAAYTGPLPVVLFGDHTRSLKYTERPFALGADGVKILVPQPGFSAKYLYYFWLGAKIPSLGYSRHFRLLRELEIPKPDLREQARIVELLDQADALRRQRAEADAKLARLLPALFRHHFGDPSLNPKKFRRKTLRSIASKYSDGPFGSNLKSDHYASSGVRVIRLQNIGAGMLIDDDRAYIPEDHFASISKHECRPGDVLIGTMGDPNLRACIQPQDLPLALNKADCVQFRPNPNECTAEYVCWLLNDPSTLAMAGGMVAGQTRARISMGRLGELEIPVPPVDLQQAFTKQVKIAFPLQAQAAASAAKLETLFQTLLHRAFTGELTARWREAHLREGVQEMTRLSRA